MKTKKEKKSSQLIKTGSIYVYIHSPHKSLKFEYICKYWRGKIKLIIFFFCSYISLNSQQAIKECFRVALIKLLKQKRDNHCKRMLKKFIFYKNEWMKIRHFNWDLFFECKSERKNKTTAKNSMSSVLFLYYYIFVYLFINSNMIFIYFFLFYYY